MKHKESDVTVCDVDDCTDPARTKGKCNKHYQRWHRTGSTTLPPRGIGKPAATKKDRKPARTVEPDLVCTVTLGEWKRAQETARPPVHHVQLAPLFGRAS